MTGTPKHGGSRPGAGRKPKAAPPPPTLGDLDAARALLSGSSIEDLMELAVRYAAYLGRWDEVSKAGARLLNVRARTPAPSAPATPATPSRFAPRPPPHKPN